MFVGRIVLDIGVGVASGEEDVSGVQVEVGVVPGLGVDLLEERVDRVGHEVEGGQFYLYGVDGVVGGGFGYVEGGRCVGWHLDLQDDFVRSFAVSGGEGKNGFFQMSDVELGNEKLKLKLKFNST